MSLSCPLLLLFVLKHVNHWSLELEILYMIIYREYLLTLFRVGPKSDLDSLSKFNY